MTTLQRNVAMSVVGFAIWPSVALAHDGPCCEPEWSALGSGIENFAGNHTVVHALAEYDDGTGSALYAGGTFRFAGGVAVRNIAKWDGTAWSALPNEGVPLRTFTDLEVFDDGTGPALYVAKQNGRISRWDGEEWIHLEGPGNALIQYFDTLEVFDDGSGPALYAGGSFTLADGETMKYIARWDGETWSEVGEGVNNRVEVLCVFDDGLGPALYAGGVFTVAGDKAASRIAKWDGTEWLPLGSGLDSDLQPPSVGSLAVFDDGSGPAIYVGGFFDRAGGVQTPSIAKWEGTEWSSVGGGTNGGVISMEVFDDGAGSALYAAGVFSTAGEQIAMNIARWDGSDWSPLGSGTDGILEEVYDLTTYSDGNGSALYAGGWFTEAGGVDANRVARWGCVSPPCPQDVFADGVIDMKDLNLVLAQFGEEVAEGDTNGDCVVDLADLNAVLGSFGNACP